MRERLKTAAQDSLVTAVRWLVAPLILIVVFGSVAWFAYDYSGVRASNRDVVQAINSGRLLQILGEQQKKLAEQQARPQGSPQP